MSGYEKINPAELENAIKMIGKDWMLITAYDEEKKRVNAMTASWGAMGELWNKPICICFVRPQRYTHKLLEREEKFSIGFFNESYREQLRLCGRESGRDIDKIAACGFSSSELDGAPIVEQADVVLICRKLYRDEIKENCFLDVNVTDTYKNKDYHTFYICEIEEAYRRA